MNINSLIRAARAVTQAEEADPLPTHGPLTDAIDALRKELTPRASILDALTISKPERRPASVPKQRIERNDKYLRLVAARPCKFCGAVGQSQAAHENNGKGLGMKTSDVRTFPLCHVGANDCHGRFDRYELFQGRQMHIQKGQLWAFETAHEIRAEGLWPAGLEFPY